MANKVDQTIAESMPWYGKCALVPEYSVGRIAVFEDKFPVTEGHLLFVPLQKEDGMAYAINKAYRIGRDMVKDEIWDGFNVGVNYGEAAGQTVKWPHVHLIPRHVGDCKDPTGGVRGVIPRRQNWKKAAAYTKLREESDIDGI